MTKKASYSCQEAAEELGVSRVTLLRWFREGRITEVSRDWRGWRTFSSGDLEQIRRELGQANEISSTGRNVKMRQYLSRVPTFGSLPEALLDELSICAVFRGYLKGKFVFQPGQLCGGLHLLAKGRVRIYRLSPEGREQLLSIIEPYQTLGESALFEKSRRYSSYAQCDLGSTIISLPFQRVRTLIREYPELSLAFLAEFATRIQHLEQRLEETALHSLEKRLANYLIREMNLSQKKDFVLQPTAAIASLLGVARETVSRALNRFEEQGWIRRNHREFEVLNSEELLALCS